MAPEWQSLFEPSPDDEPSSAAAEALASEQRRPQGPQGASELSEMMGQRMDRMRMPLNVARRRIRTSKK